MRVLIVGGRQSAYEWAALLREHGAERIDIVHRHDVPRFERVSWEFVDEHVERTLNVRGYWRNLAKAQQEAIARRFWRLAASRSSTGSRLVSTGAEFIAGRGPRSSRYSRLVTTVVSCGSACRAPSTWPWTGSSSHRGIGPTWPRVPFMAGVVERIELVDGFPALDEAFGPQPLRPLRHGLLGHPGLWPLLRLRQGRARRGCSHRARSPTPLRRSAAARPGGLAQPGLRSYLADEAASTRLLAPRPRARRAATRDRRAHRAGAARSRRHSWRRPSPPSGRRRGRACPTTFDRVGGRVLPVPRLRARPRGR
jgi:hypothetical protein